MLKIILFFFFASLSLCDAGQLKPSSVFRADEVQMHKYCAVLAATESTRQLSQSQIKSSLNTLQYFWHRLRGTSMIRQAANLRSKNKGVDVACSNYERRVESALRSYGMNVDDFNDITRQVNSQSRLKHKVLKQAHYYKVAADVEENLKPVTPLYPTLGGGFALLRYKLDESWDSEGKANRPFRGSQLTRFAYALLDIERERQKQRGILKADLHVRELPPKIGDPDIQPAMSPVIQKSVEMFPKVVTGIVQDNGLYVEEFNNLYKKMNGNPIFRWSVQCELDRLTAKKTKTKK